MIVVVTGTPGTGKTSLVNHFPSSFKKLYVSDLAIEQKLVVGFDEKLETHILDEEKINKAIRENLHENTVIETHTLECVLENINVDKVLVLRTDPKYLFLRLKKRNYNSEKIQNNIDCEIFEVIEEEARTMFGTKVRVLENNTKEDLVVNSTYIKNVFG